MTTLHARQIQLKKMLIRKTNKLLYIDSNFFSTILHTRSYTRPSIFTILTPIHILPITPPFTPSIRCTSLNVFTLLHDFHFTSLHFTSFHYTFQLFSAHFNFSLAHLNNRLPCPLFKVFNLQGKFLTLLQVVGSSL